jgi:hypothetical protein
MRRGGPVQPRRFGGQLTLHCYAGSSDHFTGLTTNDEGPLPNEYPPTLLGTETSSIIIGV